MVQFSMNAQTVEFSDDFESGTGNWTLQGSWGTTATQSNSASNSLTDSPGGNYAANLNISATMATGVDLTTALDAELTFWAIYDIEGGNFDYCYVEASADGGATWVNVATFLGQGNLSPWVEYTYSLGGFVGNDDVRVRFRLFTDGGFEVDGIYIDDVEITSNDEDNAAPLVIHTPPEFYESSAGDVTMVADLIDVSGIGTATLIYSVDNSPLIGVSGTNTSNDTYEFVIPEQDAGSEVSYFLTVIDASPNTNSIMTSTFNYIAGDHLIYDNGAVDFINSFGPAAASGFTSCAVRFSLFGNDVKYALIRNYTDTNRPNDDFEFHIWADENGLPGADLITPFMVTPEATLVNTSPMTRVDLSAYAAELSGISGDVFMGFTVPAGGANGQTWVVQTTPAVGNRTFTFNGTAWAAATDDYHFRLVTTSTMAADDCADATDINPLFGSAIGVTNDSPIFDNTDATVSGTEPTTGTECFDDGTFENTQWYTFMGDGNVYSIEASNCGLADYNDDTQMAVFSGGDCNTLMPVACNEDLDFNNDIYDAGVTIETMAGVTYYILIDGWDGNIGEYCLQVSQTSLITCDDIATGTGAVTSTALCFGDSATLSTGGDYVIPPIGPLDAFAWGLSTNDISGVNSSVFADTEFLGSFGLSTGTYDVLLINNAALGLPAGTYYFTPIVFGGGVDTDNTLAGLDFTNGCFLAGTSLEVTLYPEFDDLTATPASVDEITPPGNNGEASVTVAGGSGTYTYMWDNGETTDMISGLTTGDYTVTISDETGCVDPIIETISVGMIVGLDELAFNQAVQLYPNPAQNQASLNYDFSEAIDFEVRITNSLGQLMMNRQLGNVQNGTLDLDLSRFTTGVYFVNMSDGEHQIVRRLVISK